MAEEKGLWDSMETRIWADQKETGAKELDRNPQDWECWGSHGIPSATAHSHSVKADGDLGQEWVRRKVVVFACRACLPGRAQGVS